MSKVLIIEDEEKLRNELGKFLKNNGYEVELLNNFNDTLNYLINSKVDLILMDINLPNIDGESLCKEYRKTSNTPIIIVTSKNTELDELISINYGADDFITKPYNPQILLARIERIIKRTSDKKNIIKYKELELDISKSLIINDTKSLEVTKNELKILCNLLNNKGHIVSRDELMDYLWDNDEFIDDNTLTVNINRLRNKLDELGLKNIIETRRGQGYIIL